MSRHDIRFNLILLWMKWRNFVIHAADMPSLRGSYFIIMVMACLSRLLMVKFGSSIRSSIALKLFILFNLMYFFQILLGSHWFYRCRVIHNISPCQSVTLIPGWKHPQFMFLTALLLGWLWMLLLRWNVNYQFGNLSLRLLFDINLYFNLDIWLFFLMVDSFMNGVLRAHPDPQGIAFCLLLVKHTKLFHRVLNFLLTCLHLVSRHL